MLHAKTTVLWHQQKVYISSSYYFFCKNYMVDFNQDMRTIYMCSLNVAISYQVTNLCIELYAILNVIAVNMCK